MRVGALCGKYNLNAHKKFHLHGAKNKFTIAWPDFVFGLQIGLCHLGVKK
jgi:hypothetical protein